MSQREKQLEDLLREIGPWGARNAAENVYCLFCADKFPELRYKDQAEHHPSCKWLQIMVVAPPEPAPARPMVNLTNPLSCAEALAVLDAFFADADVVPVDEKRRLWEVLSALRGPDCGPDHEASHSESACKLKKATTAVIRRHAFPAGSEFLGQCVCLAATDSLDSAELRKEVKGSHFRDHAREAFRALGLDWKSFNPAPKAGGA